MFQNEASAAHESKAMKIQQDLRRSCGRARDKLDLIPGSTRRVRCGVCGLFKDILGIRGSWKSAALPLTDFTIQFLAKIQTLKSILCG